MNSLLHRYRLSLGIFIFGLIVSGLTAFPLLHEMRFLGELLDISNPENYAAYSGLQHWIAYVWFGLEQTHTRFPFLSYGTDWLAFGHICIAVFFIRPLSKPLESDWVLKCGLIFCAGVIPLALIAGQVRGIPIYWRLIDCSFGILGALPLLYCLRISREMQTAASNATQP